MNLETFEKLPSACFDYSDEPPQSWPETLDNLHGSGVNQIRTRVYWGAHEPLKGVRDFGKSSRLKLERFLKLAQERSLSVEIVLGFPPAKETFPTWTFAVPSKNLALKGFWDCSDGGYFVLEFPSLGDSIYRRAFLDFLAEAFSILALYRSPGGPICAITVDFGIYEANLSTVELTELYAEALGARYADVEALNKRYQTSFKNFGTVATRQGIRVLSDKRPWLSAYDFKWCRRYLLTKWQEEIAALPSARPLASILRRAQPKLSEDFLSSSWSLALDPVLLDGDYFDYLRPLVPSGFIHPHFTQAFRLFDYLRFHADSNGVPKVLLPHLLKKTDDSHPLIVVTCGKYLTGEAFVALDRFVRKGGEVFFPFTLPKYDEEMASYDWGPLSERIPVTREAASLLKIPIKKGSIWIPTAFFEYGDGLWEKTKCYAEAILREQSV